MTHFFQCVFCKFTGLDRVKYIRNFGNNPHSAITPCKALSATILARYTSAIQAFIREKGRAKNAHSVSLKARLAF